MTADAADILYGQSEPSAEGHAGTETITDAASVLYATPPVGDQASPAPESVLKQRESDTARTLYSPQVEFADLLPVDRFIEQGMDADTATATATELREMAADFGGTPGDVRLVIEAMTEVHTTPPTAEQIAAGRAEGLAALQEAYGDQTPRVCRDALTFLEADPRRAALLESVGHDPRVILRVAQLAQQARRAGKL